MLASLLIRRHHIAHRDLAAASLVNVMEGLEDHIGDCINETVPIGIVKRKLAIKLLALDLQAEPPFPVIQIGRRFKMFELVPMDVVVPLLHVRSEDSEDLISLDLS